MEKTELGSRQLFMVLRVDTHDPLPLDVNADIIATKAYWSEEAAIREVERLNALNGPKGSVYLVTMARLQTST